MAEFTLVIGNRNYSSWSMRAWLTMRQTGAEFEEVMAPLGTLPGLFTAAQHSPTRMVPVLRHGRLVVWDSLAIVEYLAELFPVAGVWPEATDARTAARSACAEMHAGFAALRAAMPMNARASRSPVRSDDAVAADITRIVTLWRFLGERFGAEGPFLCGPWGAVDAFYAPVVSRFRTYGVVLEAEAQAYVEAVLAWPWVADWLEAARSEPWAIDRIDAL